MVVVDAQRSGARTRSGRESARRHRSVANTLLIALAAAVAMAAGQAHACAICRCGDPTFNALGLTGVTLPGLRLALDWDSTGKSEGSIATGDFQSMDEERLTLLLGYGVSDDWGLFLRIPHSTRDLTEQQDDELEQTHSSGFGDPEVYAQRRLWSSEFDGNLGVRTSLFAVFGVKTDWGENERSENGERLDEHAQPGTGSVDWFAGFSGSHLVTRKSSLFASIQYRATGANDFGYEYGDILLGNLAYEYKVSSRFDAVIEANYRHADRDRIDHTGALDGNTGGTALYETPRLLVNVGKGWILRGAVQIPVADDLHGVQDEDPVYDLGFTYLVRHASKP